MGEFSEALGERAKTLSYRVLGAAIEVHRHFGPGLLESIYHKALLREIELAGMRCAQQKAVPISYKGIILGEDLRFDLLVEDCLLIEVKAIETINPIHKAQLLSYMRLLRVPVGLLINFNVTILKSGVSRLLHSGYFPKKP